MRATGAFTVITILVLSAVAIAAPAGAGGLERPRGEPIKIMTIGEFDVANTGNSNPEWPGAVRARARAINRSGGIGGRPVDVIVCNAKQDPNVAAACARKAVDEGVVAVIGAPLTEGTEVFPLLEEHNIASIGTIIADPTSAASKAAFPIASSAPGAFAAMPQILVSEGAKKVAIAYGDIGGPSALALKFYEDGLKKVDGVKGPVVAVPVDTTDFAPAVAAATAAGTDGVVTFFFGDAQGTFLQTLHTQAGDVKAAAATPFLTPKLLDSLGDAADGVLVIGSFVPLNSKAKAARMFRRDMHAFDSDLALTDISLNSWAATWVFERVAKNLDVVDAPSVFRAMSTLSDFDMGGIAPPLTTTQESTVPLMPRLFNRTVTYNVVRHGRIVALDKGFKDPF